ncbi:MAG: TIGR02530 family flagellar biosynthesis protein [Bacteriovoracaceae bacterium]|jgi:flagellar operon protein
MSKINSFLIPNVNTVPTDKKVEQANNLQKGEKSEFKGLLDQVQGQQSGPAFGQEVSVSSHAMKRLNDRNIEFDSNEYMKIKEAIGKLKAKGGHDSLVITGKAAYVVDVDRNTVVTAVDKNSMNENVFTKIDSTIFMS